MIRKEKMMILNEEELRREVRLTKKLLNYFDKEINELLKDERLTEGRTLTAGTLRSELLDLSAERRQLLSQLIGRSPMINYISEKH
jgi:dsDNA-specific endonuclease/ATPase MutS2